MGGSTSQLSLNNRSLQNQGNSSSNNSPKKPRKNFIVLQNASSRIKATLKRKARGRDNTRPFRELTLTWPLEDVRKLLKDFEASAYLLSLQSACDSTRRETNCFRDDLQAARTTITDFSLTFKGCVIKVHKYFLLTRCKGLSRTEQNTIDVTAMAEDTTEDCMRLFIDYVYTEVFEGDPLILQSLRTRFGCEKSLNEDCLEMEKQSMHSGDLKILMISTVSSKKKKSDASISCDSQIVSSRSSVFRSLIARNSSYAPITFDENVFPREFAAVFLRFIYTDELDLSLMSSSEATLSSLSEARAIVSGKSADIQLHRAMQLMQLAKFFEVPKLVQSCEDVVFRHLNVDNCVAVLHWGRDGASHYVATNAFRLLEREFTKISATSSLFEISANVMAELTASHFAQATELELLEAIIKWGEHELLRKMEEREPNVVSDTCHSISRRGLRNNDLAGEELREILSPLALNIRKDYALPPFHQTLTDAYKRGLLERNPLREDLVVCETTSEINPDLCWLRPAQKASGPRYYRPYHAALEKHCEELCLQSSSSGETSIAVKQEESAPNVSFRNLFPQILEDDLFERVTREIKEQLNIAEREHSLSSFSRSFYKNFAVQLIARRVLTRFDVSEECVEVLLVDDDEVTVSCSVEKGKIAPSSVSPARAPDVLPSQTCI